MNVPPVPGNAEAFLWKTLNHPLSVLQGGTGLYVGWERVNHRRKHRLSSSLLLPLLPPSLSFKS